MTFEEQRYQGGRIEGFLVSIVVHFERVFLPLAGFAYLSQLRPLFVVFRQRGKFSNKNYELRLRNPTNPYQSHKKCCCCYLVDNPIQLITHHSHGKT